MKKAAKKLKRCGLTLIFTFELCLLPTGCGLIEDLQETPEYPSPSFSIVGTWKYNIKPFGDWGMPEKNHIYGATGYLTFTSDGNFSYIIHSDNGIIKGYGKWDYDGDEDGVDASSGVYLYYIGWEDARDVLIENGASGFFSDTPFHSYISWGNPGDNIEDDYMLVGSNSSSPIKEYWRVETISYIEELTAYRSLNSDPLGEWALVNFEGYPEITIPNDGVNVLDSWNKNHQNNE